MQDYRVELDAYSGPLDLLLYLVKRHEIDLNNIPIATLTDQYLKHLQLMKNLDIDLAGEFLVMASTLLEIKSAMLVPRFAAKDENTPETSDTATTNEVLDPRYELVQQLLAYKRFKDAANELDDRLHEWESRFVRLPPRNADTAQQPPIDPANMTEEDFDAEPAGDVELDMEDVHILDLCEAFARILESVGQKPAMHEVLYDDTPIALHAEDILDRLEREGPLSLQEMFVGRRSRGELIGLFLAMLELTRQRKLRVIQDQVNGEIKLERRPEEPEAALSIDETANRWKNPQTGEIEYEWPSEQAKLRAEKRAKLRLTRFRNKQAGEQADGTDDADEIIDLDEPEAAADVEHVEMIDSDDDKLKTDPDVDEGEFDTGDPDDPQVERGNV